MEIKEEKLQFLDLLNEKGGQVTGIINAAPFPELIRFAFSNIPEGKVGYAFLYNISMASVDAHAHWSKFQNVWLSTYANNEKIKAAYILIPTQDKQNLKPCAWTSISGLKDMVKEYKARIGPNPQDLPLLSALCRKTFFSVVPSQKGLKETAGMYAFGLYVVLPEGVNILKLLTDCDNEDIETKKKALNEFRSGTQLILGAGIDTPYSAYTHPAREYSYKYVLVIPRFIDDLEKGDCIVKEHIELFAELWRSRDVLKIPFNKRELDNRVQFLNQNTFFDPTNARYVPLDYAFLWYHFFLNSQGNVKKGLKRAQKESYTQAREFLEDIRGGVPGNITDESLRAEIQHILDNMKIEIGPSRRIGDFIWASEEGWEEIKMFLDTIENLIDLSIKGEKFKEKEVGFRCWGKVSAGKTFLIREWARELCKKKPVIFCELPKDIALISIKEIESWVNQVHADSKDKTVLAFIDEIDKIDQESEKYDKIFRMTKVVEDNPPGKIVLLIAGSAGREIGEMDRAIRNHKSGDDLLVRTKNIAFPFPEHKVIDRLYIAAGRIMKKSNKMIGKAEFMALISIAVSPYYAVSDFDTHIDNAVRKCLTIGDTKIMLRNVFIQADSELKYIKSQYPKTYAACKDIIIDICE